MDIIHFPDDPRPARWTQPVLALGNFDGLHRGHRKILDRVCRVAGERGATSVVMTFDPHPPRGVRPDEADSLRGHKYYTDGTVVHGDHRGRTIGFPTANLCSDNELLPPHGVYATTATLGGIVRPSVTNVGVRPTVDESGRTTTETHIFDFDRDLYGVTIRVGFVQRLRDERRFESLDLLKAQIAADCARARV